MSDSEIQVGLVRIDHTLHSVVATSLRTTDIYDENRAVVNRYDYREIAFLENPACGGRRERFGP